MEFASFLAGERWSDHPSCTHPLLAGLARAVNDLLGEDARQDLVPLIPSVVGRRGDERTWLALPVAVAAAPIYEVPEASQRALAAGLLRAEQLCADAGPALSETRREARAALDLVPGAEAWAKGLRLGPHITPRIFTTRSAPTMVRCAAEGIAKSGGRDRDARLHALLETAIAACPAPQPVGPAPEVAPAR